MPPPEPSATQESVPDQSAEVPAPTELPPTTDESSASFQNDVPNEDAPSGVQDPADIVLESAPSETVATESVPKTAVPPASE
ncbi:MAG: hypothetical protein WA194_02095 [Patescibacteria group bacterium]